MRGVFRIPVIPLPLLQMVSLTKAAESINRSRFEELFTEHEPSIRRYVRSLRIVDPSGLDDLMQDTALALWRKFDAFDPARPFAPWACRFAYVQVLKYRQNRQRDRLVFDEEQLTDRPTNSPDESEIYVARRRALGRSLKLLSESDRQLICCRYQSNDTVQCLAKRQGISVHKLYHSLDHIRESLRISASQFLLAEGWERAEIG